MLALFFIGYLIGSIPFGLLLTKLAGFGDIRQMGSGNIGATNVLRTGNKFLALATLLLDAGKGTIPILLFLYIDASEVLTPFDPVIPEPFKYRIALIIGLGTVLGHMFPPWLKFKGGKGVATALGSLLAAVPLAGAAACATWVIMFAAFRISSLSALTAATIAPITATYIYDPYSGLICAIISILVWIRHKDNIKRLLKGEEPKVGKKKDAGGTTTS